MNLNDLLRGKGIESEHVLVLRHRPGEPELYKVLPWLAAEKPDVFNAYQQTQTEQVEREMKVAEYVAAFIGLKPKQALFVGWYSVKGYKSITRGEYWQIPANVELKAFGHEGFTEESSRSSIYWFDLALLTEFYPHWKGKLLVDWPPKDMNRHRWVPKPKNETPVRAIREESDLDAAMPEWDSIDLTWIDLRVLPMRWKAKLSEWRGIYYIFDTSDARGCVGAAYGEKNLLGRRQNYAAQGRGGNRLLRQRDAQNFRFTILQRVSPDMEAGEVLRLEGSWKERLHTRDPHGLNDN